MEPRPLSRLGITAALAIAALLGFWIQPAVLAQGNGGQTASLNGHRAVCTDATATGTYGYRMNGVIVGVGPFLVNGIYTHHPDGTMDADVQLVVGNQTFPLLGSGGTFHTNADCTGSGRFSAAPVLPEVTYNFVVTDDGDQIELLNTDPFVVLQGISRRISKPGKEPHCANDMILGSYGYRLEGSLPGVPNAAVIGLVTQRLENLHDDVGIISGRDVLNVMGGYISRQFAGTFSVGSNCRGTGTFTDATNRTITYVFTAVNDGDMLFLQGTNPGDAIWGVAQRVR